MPEILTYNTPSKIAKERIKQPFYKGLFDWFSSQDKFTRYSILTLLLIITATPFIVNNYLETRQRAQSPPQEDKSLVEEKTPPKEAKFSSDGLFIKLTEKGLGRLKDKENPLPADSGINALDELSEKLKVTRIERVFKTGPKDEVLDRWYKVTFKAPKKIVEGNPATKAVEIEGVVNLTYKILTDLFSKADDVEKAELDFVITTQAVPNDLYYSTKQLFSDHDDLWGLKKIGAEQAWDKTTGKEVVVADLDTGVDYTHPDLKDRILKDASGKIIGYDFANNDADPMDDNFHGTHVAGTISATGNNDSNHTTDSGARVVGVGWDLKIMPIKGLDAYGSGFSDRLANGLKYAVDHGAKVVNNSWGCSCPESTIIADAVKYGYDRSVVIVFAAGNNNGFVSNFSPAGDPYAITVGASNYKDERACFSNYGIGMDVLAPGGDSECAGHQNDYILSTRLKNGKIAATLGEYYAIARGTSMATPHAAGAIGLILSAHPDWSVEEVRAALRGTAYKVGGFDWAENSGWGRIDVDKAVSLSVPPPVAKLNLFVNLMDNLHTRETFDIKGSVNSRSGFKNWSLQVGESKAPTSWNTIASGTSAVNGTLATINSNDYASGIYTVKLNITDNNNVTYSDISVFYIDNEVMEGWPRVVAGWTQPAIADLNGDGKNEIIDTSLDRVAVFNSDGTFFSGFPKFSTIVSGALISYNTDPVLADVDRDGKNEIIIATTYGYLSSNPVFARIWVFKSNGSLLAGWPQIVSNETAVRAPATIADINADGKTEILINGEQTSKVYAYEPDGSQLVGWPVTAGAFLQETYEIRNGPVSASDIDGDGKMEVFIGSNNGSVYGFNYNGTPLSGWPQKLDNYPIMASVGIADINGDGKKEIVAVSPWISMATAPISKINAYTTSGQLLWSYSIGGGFSFSSSLGFIDLFPNKGLEIFQPGDLAMKIFGIDGAGTPLPGWPVSGIRSHYSAASFADITGDNVPEIAWGINFYGYPGGIVILNKDGQIIWHRGYEYSYMGPSFGDINGDGKLDLVGTFPTANLAGNMFVWSFDNIKVANNQIIWGQYMGNAQHTGIFEGTVVSPPSPIPSPSPSPSPTVVPVTPPAGSDTQPPTVSITAPVNGAIVARNFKITIQAGASDNVAVARVDFLVNGSLICSDTTASYSCNWKTSGKPNASYTLTAKAYDTSGNTSSVTITVKSTK